MVIKSSGLTENCHIFFFKCFLLPRHCAQPDKEKRRLPAEVKLPSAMDTCFSLEAIGTKGDLAYP